MNEHIPGVLGFAVDLTEWRNGTITTLHAHAEKTIGEGVNTNNPIVNSIAPPLPASPEEYVAI
ncbi:MAG: hypothetical protein R3C05_18665 [Pirellulaceae bacterium]